MSPQQRAVQQLLYHGRTYAQICRTLHITPENLHCIVYKLRKQGVSVEKRAKPLALSPKQKQILTLYAQSVPIPEIAEKLNIGCQTVMNHASQGFARLGFTTSGTDRLSQLRQHLGMVTMEDPAFN